MHDALHAALCRACAQVGIEPRDVPTDGKWHRTNVANDARGKDDGSIRLFPDSEGGQVVNWKADDEPLTFFVDSDHSKLSAAEIEARQDRREKLQQASQDEIDVRHAIAEKVAKAVLKASTPVSADHPYLLRKGVRPTTTLKCISIHALTEILGYVPKSSGDALTGVILIVPVKTDGKLATLEMIDETGRKTALARGKKRGGFWMTQRLSDGPAPPILIIAEGVATALSIQQSSGVPAIAALSCHNLLPVAHAVQTAYPNTRLVIASDLGNGQRNAVEAAMESGLGLAIPRFTDEQVQSFTARHGKSPTDFNDLHQVAGPNEVAKQIKEAVANLASAASSSTPLATLATLAADQWPKPDPIAPSFESINYPVDALPIGIREAVLEVQRFTQSPVAMVACSALSVLSLAAQALINVQRAEQLLGPISLFFLIIADSGERKSSNDGHFSGAVRDYERNESARLAPVLAEFNANLLRWEAKKAGLVEAIKAAAKKHEGAFDQEQALMDHEPDKPRAPWIPQLVYSDATPEALTHGLAVKWPSAAILSSEGGGVLGSHGMSRDTVMRYFSILNELWDGRPLRFDRRTSESYSVHSARLSVALQVQEVTIKAFLEQTKGLARGTGFLARFLIAWPTSTQGTRLFKLAPKVWPALNAYRDRLTRLLSTPLPVKDHVLTPDVVPLSPQASAIWVAFHDRIELELAVGGELSELRDVGSKAADNAARLAGLFHAFAGELHLPISGESMASATQIVGWHLLEARRFLSETSLSPDMAQALVLDRWLIKHAICHGVSELAFSAVLQRGPNGLRKNAVLTAALKTLEGLNRIRVYQLGRARWIQINPELLPKVAAPDTKLSVSHA